MFVQIRTLMHAITETKAKRMFVSLLKYQSGFALRTFRISYILYIFASLNFPPHECIRVGSLVISNGKAVAIHSTRQIAGTLLESQMNNH